MIKSVAVVSHDDPDKFTEAVVRRSGKMQFDDNLEVEIQYSSNIQNHGKVLFTAMIVGRARQ